MKIYIKNMVSLRCKMVVGEELTKLGLHYTSVELGEVEIIETISAQQQEQIGQALVKFGFELIHSKKAILIQKIKTAIIGLVYYSEEPLSLKLSEYLSQQLHRDYTYLANIFSEEQGMTIERFFIINKIEHVKELLTYNELTLTEIAYKMHYSSMAHLSAQFKKVTSLTPSQFKQLNDKGRSMLEDL